MTQSVQTALRALTVLAVGACPVLASEIEVDGLDVLPAAQIYLLGEVHDNAQHHRNQARAVAAMNPSALVFEMLTPDQAAAGQDAPRGDASALDDAFSWSDGFGLELELWHPIFLAAPDAKIYGAAIPRPDALRAMSEGAAAVFGDQAKAFGLTQALPDAQQQIRETLQDEAHCGKLPKHLLPGMVEVQRLWDASYAHAALKALRDTGGPVVVITGNGHVVDWAMPAALAAAAPDVRVVSIGQVTPDEQDPPYQHWFTGPATARDGDPCDAFK